MSKCNQNLWAKIKRILMISLWNLFTTNFSIARLQLLTSTTFLKLTRTYSLLEAKTSSPKSKCSPHNNTYLSPSSKNFRLRIQSWEKETSLLQKIISKITTNLLHPTRVTNSYQVIGALFRQKRLDWTTCKCCPLIRESSKIITGPQNTHLVKSITKNSHSLENRFQTII